MGGGGDRGSCDRIDMFVAVEGVSNPATSIGEDLNSYERSSLGVNDMWWDTG